jgi:hypothetical protein
MTQRQLDQLTDLCHLLSATTDIVITDLVQVALFILPLDRLTLAVDDGILCDNTVLRGIDLNNLELHLSHTSTYCEQVSLFHGSVGFTEVWGEVDVEKGSSQTLYGVCNGKNGNPLGLQRNEGLAFRFRLRGHSKASLHI